MASLAVWAVFIVTTVILGLAAHNFSVRTERWVSAITAVILVCVITRYESDNDQTQCTLSRSLRLDLLTAAMQVLREVRVQLTLGHVAWATIRHRNERAVWLPYWAWLPGWGLRRRWAFHDGVRVAELLVATRIKLRTG